MPDKKAERMEKIRMAYEDAMNLYEEGLPIEMLKEVLELYEEKEIYEACEGIKQAIQDINKQLKTKKMKTEEITMEGLAERISEDFGKNLKMRCNKREHTYPKSIFYTLCREFTDNSLWEIADFIGVTHATVLNGVNNTFHDAINYERKYRNYYKKLKDELKGLPTVERRLEEALIKIEELEHTLNSYRNGTFRRSA